MWKCISIHLEQLGTHGSLMFFNLIGASPGWQRPAALPQRPFPALGTALGARGLARLLARGEGLTKGEAKSGLKDFLEFFWCVGYLFV